MTMMWIALIGGVLCISAGFLISFHVFQVKAVREDRVVFIQIVYPGAKFATKYIHSVEKSPVWDFFFIDDDFRIVLYETTFSSCNTGLPCTVLDGEQFHVEGDRFRISHMHRIIPALQVWIHERYDNVLKMEGSQHLRLPALAGNTLVQMNVEKMTAFGLIYARLCLWWNKGCKNVPSPIDGE